MDKAFKNIDRALSKNATLNMAICIFLIVYLAFDIKDYIPGFLNNELVRLVVIVVAVYLILRCNMNKISASSHACTAGILLLLAAVLHNRSEGFFGRSEGFETYTKKDGEKTYVVDVAQAQATEEEEPAAEPVAEPAAEPAGEPAADADADVADADVADADAEPAAEPAVTTGGGAQQQSGQHQVVGIQEGEYASL